MDKSVMEKLAKIEDCLDEAYEIGKEFWLDDKPVLNDNSISTALSYILKANIIFARFGKSQESKEEKQ